jgi:hypothetical protein
MYLSYSAIQGRKGSDALPSRSSSASESVSTLRRTSRLMREFDLDGVGSVDFFGKVFNVLYLSEN